MTCLDLIEPDLLGIGMSSSSGSVSGWVGRGSSRRKDEGLQLVIDVSTVMECTE